MPQTLDQLKVLLIAHEDILSFLMKVARQAKET